MTSDLAALIRTLRIEQSILNDRVAEAVGLHPRDLDILDVIDRDGPCTPKYLAARTGVHSATLTGILARLQSDGWISRHASDNDKRSSHVRATERFQEIRRHYPSAAARDLEQRLTAPQRELITRFLSGIIEIIRERQP